MSARPVAVVGPSGAGKDTLMAAAAGRRSDVHLVRRVITRAADAGGEDFEAVSQAEFVRRAATGAFALQWRAHGLSYGIPRGLPPAGIALMNLSRSVLAEASQVLPGLRVVSVAVTPEVMAARLAGRGRETPEDIAARLARDVPCIAPGLDIRTVDNSGDLADALDAFLIAIGDFA